MKNALTLIAVAGIASVASAQSASLTLVPSMTSIDSSTNTMLSLEVWGDADFGTAISGGGFALTAAGGAGVVSSMSVSVPTWAGLGFADGGDGGDGNYNGVVFGQLIFPPFLPADPASMLANGPVLLATFDVTIAANSSGLVDWSTADSAGDFTLEIYTDDGGIGQFDQLQGSSIDFGGARVSVTNGVPAPSAMALLGLGGLVAGRRRR